MTLATELGELTKYFRRSCEGQFPAPGAPLEDNAIPENVGQLLVATLATVRTLQEEQHAVRSDIAELKLLMQAHTQQWNRDMGLLGECFTELPTIQMMEPMFKKVGELVLDTTSEVQAARESIQQLVAQGVETLQSRVGSSFTVPNQVSITVTSATAINLEFI